MGDFATPNYLGQYLGSIQALTQIHQQHQQTEMQQKQLQEAIRAHQADEAFRQQQMQRSDLATQLSLHNAGARALDDNGNYTAPAAAPQGGAMTQQLPAGPDGMTTQGVNPAALMSGMDLSGSGGQFTQQQAPSAGSMPISFGGRNYSLPSPEEQGQADLQSRIAQARGMAEATGIPVPPEVAAKLGMAPGTKVPPSIIEGIASMYKNMAGGDKETKGQISYQTDDSGDIHPLVFDPASGNVKQLDVIKGGGKSRDTAGEKQAAELSRQTAMLAATLRAGGGSEDITPEAIDQAATMYAKTGQMPSVGFGKDAAALRKKIMNRAAVLVPANDLSVAKADFNANKGSLADIQKRFDGVTAFERTAEANLDNFLKQAKFATDSGSPLLNAPLRALNDKVLGSPGMAAFKAARTTALTETAKVLSSATAGGVLSDDARREVESLASPNATLPQMVKAVTILKQDMANRKKAYSDQISDIHGRLSGMKFADDTSKQVTHKYNPATGKIEAVAQ